MTNFTPREQKTIQSVTQKSLLDAYEYSDSSNNANADYHRYNTDTNYNHSIRDVVQNYDTAFSEQVTDTMFLLDVKQINTVYNNGNILGEDYYIGIPTAVCVINSEITDLNFSAGKKWNTWLRSPCNDGGDYRSSYVRYVSRGGSVSYTSANGDYASDSYPGIRPAFYLNLSSIEFIFGTGTDTNPYGLWESGSAMLTSTTYRETASAYKFYVEFEHDIDAASMIVAGYSENQKMVSCVLTECDEDSYYIVTLPKEDPITSVKVFVWDPDALEPLGESEIILISG